MKNIYVGNLSFNATEDQVRGLFEAYGPVDRVSIVTDRDTGQSRGFAFVEMSDDDAAQKAMEALNGSPMGGRNLTVNEARPKADRPRHEGGGGGTRWSRRPRRRWWWRRRLGTVLVRQSESKNHAGAACESCSGICFGRNQNHPQSQL